MAKESKLDTFVQFAIIIFSISAIWLLSSDAPYSRWGFIIGLAGQPFWFYSSYKNKEWGVFIVSVFFTISYTRGIYNFWIK